MKRICIFCGSKSGSNPKYIEAAKKIGAMLAEKKIGLVYGGASIGVMGAIADGVLNNGGEVIGIMPESLMSYEIAHKNLTELHVVSDMHTRKKLMYDKSDLFLTLPGGMGTLDEMFEILTWSQIGLHNKKCYILNLDHFYDSLLSHLQRIC
jgi:uncharacterized protein (TIGR00730 family)